MSNSSPENLLTVEEAIKTLESSGFSTTGYYTAAQTLIAAFRTAIDLSTLLSADYNEALRALSIANSTVDELTKMYLDLGEEKNALAGALSMYEGPHKVLASLRNAYVTALGEQNDYELDKHCESRGLRTIRVSQGEAVISQFETGELQEELSKRKSTILDGRFSQNAQLKNLTNEDLFAELSNRGCKGVMIDNMPLSPRSRDMFIEQYNEVRDKLDLPELVPLISDNSNMVRTGEHPFPGKATNLNKIILLLHYEMCPICSGELDTGYDCKQCGKEYGEWFKLLSQLDVTKPTPTASITFVEQPTGNSNFDSKYSTFVPSTTSLSLDQYQQNALITEAPVDEDRWQAALTPMLQNLIRTGAFLSQTNLDATKKFAAYGKMPDDLQIANIYKIKVFCSNIGKVIALRPVYRLLHGLVGIFTEVEELSSLINAAVDHAWDTTDEDADSILLSLEDFDIPNLKEELGDMFWYMALIADAAGFQLQECLELNELKLQKHRDKARYRTGKFTTDEAISRDTAAEREVFIGADFCSPGTKDYSAMWPASVVEDPPAQNLCPDCNAPLTGYEISGFGTAFSCLKCDETQEEVLSLFRSGLNKHVIGFTADVSTPDFSAHAGQWAFEDENGDYHGPFTTEDDAIAALKQYAAKNLAASHSFVDTSHDVCGYCGKTGHNINDCKERAGLAATPEKLEQEIVAVEVKAQTGIKPGDTVRSIRKSLRNYKFIVNRLGESNTALVSVDHVPTIGITGEPYALGEELSLSVDELVKVN